MLAFRRKYNTAAWISGGCICAIFALLTRIFSQSPHYLWRSISLACHLPPLWLTAVLWLAVNFLTGAIIGCILGGCRTGVRCNAYRAGIYLVMSLTAGLMWYGLLFGGNALFVSLLLVAAACIFAAVCGALLIKDDLLLGVGSYAVALWYLIVLLTQIRVIFCI